MPARRQFLGSAAVAVAAAGSLQASPEVGIVEAGNVPSLKPPFRLSEAWYRATVKRFQQRLVDKKMAGAIVADPLNRNYLTGIFLTETERPNFLFVPAKGEPIGFIPGLDRDMAASWWVKEFEWYFDFPHSGGYSGHTWKAGKRDDLFVWMLKGLAKRGFGKGSIGIDREPTPSLAKKFSDTLRETKLLDVSDELLGMRQVKTPDEIALIQKAIDLHDAMLQFARSYILENGSNITDFDVRHATEEFGTRTLMAAMGGEVDGLAHKAVGISLDFGCRAGVATAYPHPNQFFFTRIGKGQAIQIASVISIGGYGGEGYRALHVEPMNDLQKKLWEVHTEMTLRQAALCKAGTKCQDVAADVLAIAKKAGVERYVYHRPAHGQGMEGHQAPYIALGDETVLVENMTFSNEPGLYNLDGGYGYNHSNCVLVGKERGQIMNQTPLTKEFCWLKL